MTVTIADIAIAKRHKYASRESGDTVDIVDGPDGVFSVVLVDGQGSGSAARSISILVASRVAGLLRDGVRAHLAALAGHDFLLRYRQGKVSATIDIVSVDYRRRSIQITRNSPIPFIAGTPAGYTAIQCVSDPVGIHRSTEPRGHEMPLVAGTTLLIYSDGVTNAGRPGRAGVDVVRWANENTADDRTAPRLTAGLLEVAVDADDGRPRDDMTVVGLVVANDDRDDGTTRMSFSIPLSE